MHKVRMEDTALKGSDSTKCEFSVISTLKLSGKGKPIETVKQSGRISR